MALFIATCTYAQISLVSDINPGTGNSSPTNFYVYGDYVYFSADDADAETDHGRELWRTNGTTTELVKDIRSGSSNSTPNYLFSFNDNLYLSANAGGGLVAFKSDGTETGTEDLGLNIGIFFPKVINNTVYFVLSTDGNTLYTFDGTSATKLNESGTVTEKIYSGEFTLLNDQLLVYMKTVEDPDGVGIELYSYDITNNTFTLVKDINEGSSSASISNMVTIGSKVYFEALNQLYESDGTESGTSLVDAASDLTNVKNFYVWNDVLYFAGSNGTDGYQLCTYDPSESTLTQLSSISGKDHNPDNFAEMGDYLYYSGEDANSTNDYLYRTDGSSITQVDNTIIDIDDIVCLNDVLYFEGEDATGEETTGNELFKYVYSDITNDIDSENATSLYIYPNPSKGTVFVKGLTAATSTYELMTVTGSVVKSGIITNNRIDLNVNSGVYIIQITEGNNISSQKILVK